MSLKKEHKGSCKQNLTLCAPDPAHQIFHRPCSFFWLLDSGRMKETDPVKLEEMEEGRWTDDLVRLSPASLPTTSEHSLPGTSERSDKAWTLLDPDQRDQHKEVKEENRGIVDSLDGDELEGKNKGEHNRIQIAEKSYKYSECGENIRQSSQSTSHQRKSFIRRNSLTSHEITQSRKKSYQCLECGKSFNRKNNFTVHQRIHTGEKPYQCLECGKSFRQSGELTSHQRIHTGEKPYHASNVGRAFV
ncbi:zinc finger protein OZF-like isoform X2 [Podarcis lilfordi]|uniref:Zinc finger protein OZF-like isoform X2 n=1 Tax=Podarcis lilfordi TaxID=74358 RepID=A0AA35QPS4_9SAUR|nr:zinc finger protein OZF-like isoform X2 [Podarcis lilfordi]